jgi:hypothetical protein
MSAETIADRQTIEQIKAQYDSEWVVIADPELDNALEVLSGRVISHGKDRDAVYGAAIVRDSRDIACLYIGEPPADVIFIL